MDWFRSHHGAPTDPKFLVIAAKAGSKPGVVSALWWAVLDHASRATPRGSVDTFDVEVIAAFFGWSAEEVGSVMDVFRERNMIQKDGKISAWQKRQPKRERVDPKAAERAKAWRERHRTPPNATERPDREIERKEKNPSDSKRKARKPETECPEDWRPHGAHGTKAALLKLDVKHECQKFRNHHGSKGTLFRDWDLAFHTWLDNAAEFKARDGPAKEPKHTISAADVKRIYGEPLPPWQPKPKSA